MTIEAKECVLADFQVVVLAVDFPSYFQGFGCSFTEFDHCTYGIGYTEAEALDDCIEMMCQSAGVDITEEDVQRIRAEYGDCDSETTVDDILGRNDCDESDEDADDDDCDGGWGDDDCGESGYFHVGIRWNEELKDA